MDAFDYEKSWQGDWNDTTRYGPACRHRRRIVARLALAIPHESLLDLGCGDGQFLSEIAPHDGARLFGADISAQAIEIARRRVPRAEFLVLDLSKQEMEGSYDVVVLSEVLEHIENDDQVLAKLAPRVRHVVISVPGGPADQVDRRYGHFRNYAGDLLQRKMEAAGFEVTFFRRWGMPFFELIQFLTRRPDDGSPPPGGRFSPLKRLVASVLYYVFFLNLVPAGQQVFAVGRSRVRPA